MKAFSAACTKCAISLIDFYSKCLKTLKLRTCRFYPTCSAYTKEALEKKGFFKGMGLGIWRVVRCNPFSRGGYDPVEHDPCTQRNDDEQR